MFTGAVIGATTWLPPRMLDRPDVRFPPAPAPPLSRTDAPPTQPATASPKIATALPQALIGAVIGATTWLPPPMEWSPSVRLPPPLPSPVLRTVAPPLRPASDLPNRETALPQAFTGAVIGASIWLPPRMLDRPEVRLPLPPPRPSSTTVAPPSDEALDWPATATALPLMSIGSVIGRLTWLPPPMEWSPSVSAEAVPPPNDMTATASRAAGVEAFAHVRMRMLLLMLGGNYLTAHDRPGAVRTHSGRTPGV